MSLVDSPGFEDFDNGMPVEQDSPEAKARKRWIRISLLFLAAIVLAVGNMFLNGQGGIFLGRGSLEGYIVDGLQQPLHAEVMILGQPGTVWTDEEGYFVMESIPSGNHTMLIGYMNAAQVKSVQVRTGSVEDVGLVQIKTTSRPGMEDVERLMWR